MDDLLNPFKKFISTADDKTKIELSLKLRDLANSLETPDSTLDRISFGVSQNSPMSRWGRWTPKKKKITDQVVD